VALHDRHVVPIRQHSSGVYAFGDLVSPSGSRWAVRRRIVEFECVASAEAGEIESSSPSHEKLPGAADAD